MMHINLFLAVSAFILGGCSGGIVDKVNSSQTLTKNDQSVMSKSKGGPIRTDSDTRPRSNVSFSDKSSCNQHTKYSFVEIESESRVASDPIKEMRVMDGNRVMATFELPFSDVKNLEVLSTKNSSNGFQLRVAWGGSLNHFEYAFEFMCNESELVLYHVKSDRFSTTDPGSGNYWDRKITKNTRIDPNVPIQNFVLKDYLN